MKTTEMMDTIREVLDPSLTWGVWLLALHRLEKKRRNGEILQKVDQSRLSLRKKVTLHLYTRFGETHLNRKEKKIIHQMKEAFQASGLVALAQQHYYEDRQELLHQFAMVNPVNHVESRVVSTLIEAAFLNRPEELMYIVSAADSQESLLPLSLCLAQNDAIYDALQTHLALPKEQDA